MELKLVVIKGSTKTREVRLRGAEIIVGRQRGCGLRIPSALVSRRHCRLRLQGSSVTIEDLKSVNGSFLNGVRVYGAEEVHPGDQLEIGPVTFLVEFQRTDKAARALPPPLPQAIPLAEPLPAAIPMSDGDFVEAIPLDEGAERPTVLPPHTARGNEGAASPAAEGNLPLEFDEDEAWRLPEGQDLRDLLSSADEP
jgi:predicted component of type VI protein secretion system